MFINSGRNLNGREEAQLVACLIERTNMSESEVNEMQIWATVYDTYITDGPGYGGKVITVVYSGSPSFYDTFIYNKDGKLEYIKNAY
jgi:hypothetical protein